jgi:sugar phosphate isomerase/epimerase
VRFGIMAMQPDLLMQQTTPFDHGALIEQLADRGFTTIELGGDLQMFFGHAFAPPAIERLLMIKQKRDLRYTVHLPLWSIEPSALHAPVRRGSVEALLGVINAVQPLDPDACVLHATGALAAEFGRMRLPDAARNAILDQFAANARRSIETILAETGIDRRRLAIETIEFPFERTVALAEELDVGMCLDTGHLLAGFSGPIDLWDALDRCLPRLAEIHLHDAPWQGPEQTIGYGRDHQPLGAGDLDVARLLDRLGAANWNGPIVLELTVGDALRSLEVIRGLRPAWLL